MANITGDWNKNMPSGSSLISEGDDLMRQHWRSLQSTLNDEHYFSDSKKSAGLHKTGSARIFVGPASQRSSKPTAQDVIPGRIYYERETDDMYALGSTETRINYGGGVWLYTNQVTGTSPLVGTSGTPDASRFSAIGAQWSPSGATWAVLSSASIKYVTVPSGLSGYFKLECSLSGNVSLLSFAPGSSLFMEFQKNGVSLHTFRMGPATIESEQVYNFSQHAILPGKSGDSFRVRAWTNETGAGVINTYGSLIISKVG